MPGFSSRTEGQVSTIWTRLFFVFWDDGPFSQEVLKAGSMATKGIIRRHEPEGQSFSSAH